MARDNNVMPERPRERIEAREQRLLDRFQGCLVGGVAGDALDYAVEFLDWDENWIYKYAEPGKLRGGRAG